MASIYISDLDGTLLTGQPALSDYTRSHLSRMLDAGLPFTVASARSVVSIRELLQDLPLRLPVIEFNGAFISDYTSGDHRIIHSLECGLVPEIFELIKRHSALPFISTFNGQEDCLYYESILNEGMGFYQQSRKESGDKRLREIADLRGCMEEQVVCLTVIDRRPVVEAVAAELKDRYPGATEPHIFADSYAPPGWYWLTIHDRRASKDQAIGILVEEFGFDLEGLTVFGDEVNDIKMFQLAPRAVAVANALDEVKAVATEVIGSNEEDSVVRFIERDWDRGAV
jgi:hypothetical protein